jgi:hypothetical protein
MNHGSPTIVNVTASPPALLIVEWSTGETLRTDISEQVECFAWLGALRAPECFSQAAPASMGGGVTWGDEIHMGADLLYWLGSQQAKCPAQDVRLATTLTIATEYRRTGLVKNYAGGWVPCVLRPLEEYVLNLRPPDGRPMHKDVKQLMRELLHGAVKPRKQAPQSVTAIREGYKQLCINHSNLDTLSAAVDGADKTTPDKVARLILAEVHKLSLSRIDDILTGRKLRKKQGK